MDPTITGVNAAMAPLPLHLPTVENLITHLKPGMVMAKRDWRHGFHQLTLGLNSRRFMGLRLSNRRIARFKALAFGPSESPAIFTAVANEYGRLVHLKLRSLGIRGVVLAVYIDDVFIAAPDFPTLLRVKEIMDEVAAHVGNEFKDKKDIGFEEPTTSLEFLGIQLSTGNGVVQAEPTEAKLAKLRGTIGDILASRSPPTYHDIEGLVGTLAFISQAHKVLRVLMGDIYDVLRVHRPANYPKGSKNTVIPVHELS